jgi:hypothetical protein
MQSKGKQLFIHSKEEASLKRRKKKKVHPFQRKKKLGQRKQNKTKFRHFL